MKKPRVKICRRGDAHLGEIELPMQGGSIRVQTVGWDPMSSLRRAASAALQIANDPRIAPFLPPGAALTAHTIRSLSKMSPDGLKTTAQLTDDPATQKLAMVLLRKLQEEAAKEVGADLGANPKYRFDPIRRGPQSKPRKYTGPRRGRGRPSPRRPKFGQVNQAALDRALIHQAQPQEPDPYANDPYAQQPPPQHYGGGGGGGSNAAAMQAWGAEAFDEQPDQEADDFFQAFEQGYFDGTQDDLLEYQEEYVPESMDMEEPQEEPAQDAQPTDQQPQEPAKEQGQ
jgi:hypothetical protein